MFTFRDLTDWCVELCLCDLPFRTKAPGSQAEGRCLGGEVTELKTTLHLLFLDSLIQQKLKSPLCFCSLLLFLSTGHSLLPPHVPEMGFQPVFPSNCFPTTNGCLLIHCPTPCSVPSDECRAPGPSSLRSYSVHAASEPSLTYLFHIS